MNAQDTAAQGTLGLTLGKFAPLHKGHQYMIETGLRETHHLIVVIYDCPETTDIPLTVRAGWIRRLYPQAEVIEAWNGPAETGYTPRIEKLQEDYILGLLGGRRVTHFYSSEPYGGHMSRRLGAVNRQVDPDRAAYPVSGTAVRQQPYEHRALVDGLVYRDLITRVVLLGAPSTGKTTLTAALAAARGTVWMPEYGREYWAAHQQDRRLTPGQLVELAEGHLEREEKLACEADGVLFTDTNAVTTYLFSLDYHGMALPRLEELARKAASAYDLVFLCGDDIPYDDTWDRSGEVHREMFQKRFKALLQEWRVPYIEVRGTLEERMETVYEVLRAYRKYESLGNLWASGLAAEAGALPGGKGESDS
ncbi:MULTISPECIES: AAA family ATPase [Paenibacillus]|uniref:AAA family ATPase n=1 Tax=Paenibacillus TaxID=44249 RepID=UPI0022B94032|nr:AAA family ATPase [Paenibacillus caseinilyticus]MCZ8523151.1 AAA family ATPase [Paenibacillus caseinilyticus]